MLPNQVPGQRFDSLVDHVDGRRGRSYVRSVTCRSSSQKLVFRPRPKSGRQGGEHPG